jgi:hypothetical protein
LKNPRVDRTELEEMVRHSPYGTAYVAPTMTRDGTTWSFLVHERRDVIQSIGKLTDTSAQDDDNPQARCMLVTVSARGVGIAILGLLLRFEGSPPVAYSLFMNPADPHVRELLSDITQQEKLVVEFFDDQRVSRAVRDNVLGGSIQETLASLADMGPAREVAFDLALEDLLSEHADSMSLWELLDVCLADEDDLLIPPQQDLPDSSGPWEP